MNENKVYLCQVCENGEGVWLADNNADKFARWYCESCEEIRSEKYGCAMLLDEGAMCDEGACGCGGEGVY
jgi:hypothetical protein